MDPCRNRIVAIVEAACEEEEDEVAPGGGRWSSAFQTVRALRGWQKRERSSVASRQDLQSFRHDVEHAVRGDDLMTPKAAKECGSGAWKRWTPRRALDVVFKPQSHSVRSLASGVLHGSHGHVTNLKFSVAGAVDERLKEERQKLLKPSKPHCYLIETVLHDETGMKLQPFQKHSDVIPMQNAAVSYCVTADELAAEPTYYPVPLKLAAMRGKTAGDCLGALCWQLQDKAWAGPPASAAEFVGLSLGSDGAEALQSLLACLSCHQSFQSIGCCHFIHLCALCVSIKDSNLDEGGHEDEYGYRELSGSRSFRCSGCVFATPDCSRQGAGRHNLGHYARLIRYRQAILEWNAHRIRRCSFLFLGRAFGMDQGAFFVLCCVSSNFSRCVISIRVISNVQTSCSCIRLFHLHISPGG
jgi:hypothetical protein